MSRNHACILRSWAATIGRVKHHQEKFRLNLIRYKFRAQDNEWVF